MKMDFSCYLICYISLFPFKLDGSLITCILHVVCTMALEIAKLGLLSVIEKGICPSCM